MKADKGKKHKYPKTLYTSITTDELCCYGCKLVGKFISVKNKRICCSSHPNRCPAKISKIAAKKATLDPKTGKTAHQVAGEKSLATRTRLGITKHSQIQGAKTRIKNGHYKKLKDIMQQKWANEPWANRFRVGFKKYKTTTLAFQGTYEYSFLEKLEVQRGVNWIQEKVKRGSPLWYVDKNQKRRIYLPDFIIDNNLYEIKSLYTWKKDYENNIKKLDEALKLGYTVKLILNKNELNYTSAITINMDGTIQAH